MQRKAAPQMPIINFLVPKSEGLFKVVASKTSQLPANWPLIGDL